VSILLDLQPAVGVDGVARGDVAASDGHDVLAVRAWARSRGYPIDETSGVPVAVLRTYRRVHGG